MKEPLRLSDMLTIAFALAGVVLVARPEALFGAHDRERESHLPCAHAGTTRLPRRSRKIGSKLAENDGVTSTFLYVLALSVALERSASTVRPDCQIRNYLRPLRNFES